MSWFKSQPTNHMQKHRGCNLDFALLGLKVKKLTLTCCIDQSCYLVWATGLLKTEGRMRCAYNRGIFVFY